MSNSAPTASSADRIPLEIYQLIIKHISAFTHANTRQQGLRHFCLLNKTLLPLGRAELYAEPVLEILTKREDSELDFVDPDAPYRVDERGEIIYSDEEGEEAGAGENERESEKGDDEDEDGPDFDLLSNFEALTASLTDNPGLGALVKSIAVGIDVPDDIDMHTDGVDALKALIAVCPELSSIRMAGGRGPLALEDLTKSLVGLTSERRITTLHLSYWAEGCYDLLANLPYLRRLRLDAAPFGSPPSLPFALESLEAEAITQRVDLEALTAKLTSTLRDLALNNLVFGTQGVSPAFLPSFTALRSLRIRVLPRMTGEVLLPSLEGCNDLERLVIIGRQPLPFSFFRQLPSSLVYVDLSEASIMAQEFSVGVETLRLTSLKALALPWSRWEEAEGEMVAEACKKAGLKVR